jgi:CheY-like chemotaxis protein
MVRPASKGEKVLVVEDDPLVLQLALDGLKDLGYAVMAAHNAAGALASLRQDEDISVLFSDILMPGHEWAANLQSKRREFGPASGWYSRPDMLTRCSRLVTSIQSCRFWRSLIDERTCSQSSVLSLE